MHKNTRRRALRRAFAQALRELRERAGFSQEGLALELGMGRSYLSGLERGVHSPSLETIDRFVPLLSSSLTEFIAQVERVMPKFVRH